MTNEELNTELYQRMHEEQVNFRNELMTMSPSEILDHANEYWVREDILWCVEYHNFSDKQCRALLKQKEPLAYIFDHWENAETDHMDWIRDCCEASANELVRAEFMRSRDEAR